MHVAAVRAAAAERQGVVAVVRRVGAGQARWRRCVTCAPERRTGDPLTQVHPSRRGGTVTETCMLLIEEIVRRLGWRARSGGPRLPLGENVLDAVGGTRLADAEALRRRPGPYARGGEP